MFKRMISVCVVLGVAVGALSARGEETELVKAARKTLQNYDKAVITLSAVVKFEIKGAEASGNREHRMNGLATIIDPSGLAVTSLANVAPSGRANRGGRTIEVEGVVQEVKYRLFDGTEVPARLILKDEDLDLAFLAPIKPLDKVTQPKIAFVPLGDSLVQPQVLDSTILITRTGEDLNYIPTMALGRILSLVSTPRTCYVSNGGNLGVPVFNEQGKLLGMICWCVKADTSEGNLSLRPSGILGQLILPVGDIAKLVPQAKTEAKKLAEADKKAAKNKKPKKKAADAKKTSAEAVKKPADAGKKPADAGKKPAVPEKKPADSKNATPPIVN